MAMMMMGVMMMPMTINVVFILITVIIIIIINITYNNDENKFLFAVFLYILYCESKNQDTLLPQMLTNFQSSLTIAESAVNM